MFHAQKLQHQYPNIFLLSLFFLGDFHTAERPRANGHIPNAWCLFDAVSVFIGTQSFLALSLFVFSSFSLFATQSFRHSVFLSISIFVTQYFRHAVFSSLSLFVIRSFLALSIFDTQCLLALSLFGTQSFWQSLSSGTGFLWHSVFWHSVSVCTQSHGT